jgi:hypothetical protein
MGSPTGIELVNANVDLTQVFPGLAKTGYRKTSEADGTYNCIAWAAGRTDSFWWPHADAYWPPGVPLVLTVDAFVQAYEAVGYRTCADSILERGFEKVAIYANAKLVPTHAARQVPNGEWTSKLGLHIDIRHADPNALIGRDYGAPVRFMRRRLPIWRWVSFHVSSLVSKIVGKARRAH